MIRDVYDKAFSDTTVARPFNWLPSQSVNAGWELGTTFATSNATSSFVAVPDADQLTIFARLLAGSPSPADVYTLSVLWRPTPTSGNSTTAQALDNTYFMQSAVAATPSGGIQQYTLYNMQYLLVVDSGSLMSAMITVPVIAPFVCFNIFKSTGALAADSISLLICPIIYGGGGNSANPGSM